MIQPSLIYFVQLVRLRDISLFRTNEKLRPNTWRRMLLMLPFTKQPGIKFGLGDTSRCKSSLYTLGLHTYLHQRAIYHLKYTRILPFSFHFMAIYPFFSSPLSSRRTKLNLLPLHVLPLHKTTQNNRNTRDRDTHHISLLQRCHICLQYARKLCRCNHLT